MNKNTIHFQMDADRDLIAPEVLSQRILKICVQAPITVDPSERPHLNLALVLDRSGSMSGEKLNYVKQAAQHVLNLLQEQDSVAIVAYDDEINLLSPGARVTSSQRTELIRRISQLEPGGMTNLSGGWLAGCKEVASAAQEGTINRTLLLTDGLANAGIVDLEELAQQSKELSKRGVSTSTFGVGEGFNEHLLEAMSNQGGGNFYYIGTPKEIPDLFLREFKELAAVTAREVEITLDFPPQLKLQVPGGWRTEFSAGRLHIFLGNLFSGQTQEIYIRLISPPTDNLSELVLNANVSGKGENGLRFENQAQIIIRYADQTKVEAAPQKREIMEHFALVYLAEITTEALKVERQGERDEASRLLMDVIEEYREYVNPDEVVKYSRTTERMARGMAEADRKQTHSAAYRDKRSK